MTAEPPTQGPFPQTILPVDDAYKTGHRIWNACIDNNPAVIAR
jgi:hypothetical protein